MLYEAPKIVRRERIDAVLQTLSNVDGGVSDVNLKENILAVVW
jgi:hypothetical protein